MRWVPRPAAAGCECPPAPGSPGVWGARPRGEGAAGWGALEERYSIVPEQVQWNHHRALKRMKMVGRVEVPQEAFVAALATDADIEKIKAARKAGN